MGRRGRARAFFLLAGAIYLTGGRGFRSFSEASSSEQASSTSSSSNRAESYSIGTDGKKTVHSRRENAQSNREDFFKSSRQRKEESIDASGARKVSESSDLAERRYADESQRQSSLEPSGRMETVETGCARNRSSSSALNRAENSDKTVSADGTVRASGSMRESKSAAERASTQARGAVTSCGGPKSISASSRNSSQDSRSSKTGRYSQMGSGGASQQRDQVRGHSQGRSHAQEDAWSRKSVQSESGRQSRNSARSMSGSSSSCAMASGKAAGSQTSENSEHSCAALNNRLYSSSSGTSPNRIAGNVRYRARRANVQSTTVNGEISTTGSAAAISGEGRLAGNSKDGCIYKESAVLSNAKIISPGKMEVVKSKGESVVVDEAAFAEFFKVSSLDSLLVQRKDKVYEQISTNPTASLTEELQTEGFKIVSKKVVKPVTLVGVEELLEMVTLEEGPEGTADLCLYLRLCVGGRIADIPVTLVDLNYGGVVVNILE